MKTIGAVLEQLNKPIKIRELTIPDLKPGQVLVEVAYSGVCHSQLLEVCGKQGHDRFPPHTLGHEGSGTVLKVGAGVTKIKPGDHVVLSWIKGKRIIGTWGGGTQPDRDIPIYVHLYLSGKLRLDPLITHIYSLDDINQALEDLEHGKVGRALVNMALHKRKVER